MTSEIDSATGTSASVPARVWHFLRGPRFIDLPIRLLALIMGLTILVPGSFEITEPRYAGLLILAYGLIVLAGFLPLSIVIATTGLGIAFSMLYPDLENMFPEALILATAVLISRRRWIGFALGTVGLAVYLGVSTRLGSYDAGFEGFTDLGYGWLTYSTLGLCASFVEARIRSEIDRRERAAVDHQKSLDAMRARFTSDMHDTISHSLTTESAIIRTLAKENDPETADRLLAELALVNAEATKRLRQLVTSLSRWETEACSGDSATSRVRFRAEAEQLTTAIEDGCAAGSVPLTTELAPLPTHATGTLSHHFRAVMLELATNVIRHSVPGTPATLAVEMRGERGDRAELLCRSTNESPTALTKAPRSLSRRATAVGGVCRVDEDERRRTVVEVALPVRFVSPSAPTSSKSHTVRSSSNVVMIDVVDDDFDTSAEATGTLPISAESAATDAPDRLTGTDTAGSDLSGEETYRLSNGSHSSGSHSNGTRTKGGRDKVDA
ncbi:histidine kinase [Brevibacterium sp. CT2-23B]|uniref:histidine kinase n=1 Tax=Brevibacterium sp. CT2-23B TaxID=2729630 RepID=UPI0015536C79|nr:histidine kinase [Brevibacterium sp. CT2-23B]